jgi:hypothetical protein
MSSPDAAWVAEDINLTEGFARDYKARENAAPGEPPRRGVAWSDNLSRSTTVTVS